MTQPFSGAAGDTFVAHEVVVLVVVADEPPVPLPARLRYDRADPYAVCLSLGGASTGTVDWVFARSLLTEGLVRPAGRGDVLVVPPHRCHRHSVRVVLRSAAGTAVVSIAASAVATFLAETGRVVPAGAEGLHIDLDRLVAELVAGSG
ncbi:SsgA family sporulation/cell division regulator [Streptomyces sp. NPDC088766]|uniref:SsgA family sporulation/cell division regulator n=1 Tax=Streptomyces sp. NPDC088766 TaxID=3365893 RepID=UPI0037F7D00D